MKSESDLAGVVGLLTVIAEQCGEQVSPQRLAFVAGEILKHNATKVSETLLIMMRSARRFPTVHEIEEAMGVESTPRYEEKARLMLAAIFGAIAKYGQVLPGNDTKLRRIEVTIGTAACALVMHCGGWNRVVDRLSREDESTVSAQMRELAVSLMHEDWFKFAEPVPTFEEAKRAVGLVDNQARRALEPATPIRKADPEEAKRRLAQIRQDLKLGPHREPGPTTSTEIDVDSMTRMIGGPPYE